VQTSHRTRASWARSLAVVTTLLAGCGAADGPDAAAPASTSPASPTPAVPASPSPTGTPAPVLLTETRTLPAVPSEGVLADRGGVATFRSLDGTTQVPLPGFQLRMVTGSLTYLHAKDGSTWFLDTAARQLVKQDPRYDAPDGLHLVAGLPKAEPRGHWRFILPGPGGQLLGQWSGECEVPTVYLIDRKRRLRQLGPTGQHVNAYARGWTQAGQPVVEFPEAHCGNGLKGPGLYLETRPGRYRLLTRTSQGAYYRLPAMPTTVPLCGPGAYRLKAVAEGATGNIAVGAEIHPMTTTACRLDILVTMALRDRAADSSLGDFVKVRVQGILPDREGLHADAVWQQPFCPSIVVDFIVEDSHGHSDSVPGVAHPRCDPAAGQAGRGPGLTPVP